MMAMNTRSHGRLQEQVPSSMKTRPSASASQQRAGHDGCNGLFPLVDMSRTSVAAEDGERTMGRRHRPVVAMAVQTFRDRPRSALLMRKFFAPRSPSVARMVLAANR